MCSDFVNYFIGYHRKHYMNVLIDIWIGNYLDIYALHFRNLILFLSCPFFQTFLELNRLNHCERRENTPSVCPPGSCRAFLSLCSLLGLKFRVWTHMHLKRIYSYANKRIRFTGHSSCSCQTRRFLSHSLFLSLTPFCLLAASEKGREKAKNRSLLFPCCFLCGLNGEGLQLWPRFSLRDLHQPRIHPTRSLGLTWNDIICIQWCAGPSTIETILANAIHCKLL